MYVVPLAQQVKLDNPGIDDNGLRAWFSFFT
jgi:hypothetical protein